MRRLVSLAAAATILGGAAAVPAISQPTAGGAATQHRYGRLEQVRILESTPIDIPGRLDGGGDQTELYATDVKYYSGEGGMWVMFTVDNGQAAPPKQVVLKEPVLRDLHVKARTGGIAHRPVVKLELCVGGTTLDTEVSVVERTSYVPPLVLGRPELARLGPVDTQKQFLAGDPSCKPPPPPPPSSQ